MEKKAANSDEPLPGYVGKIQVEPGRWINPRIFKSMKMETDPPGFDPLWVKPFSLCSSTALHQGAPSWAQQYLRRRWHAGAVVEFLTLVIFVASWVWIPALLYRWSVKGVSLIYSPLVWLLQSSLNASVLSALRSVVRLAMHKAIRVYAAVVFGLVAFKVAAFYAVAPWSARCAQLLKPEFCAEVIMPDALPWWQVAGALNAGLAWVAYWAADAVLQRFEGKRAEGARAEFGPALEGAFRFFWFIRSALSIYTIACTIYLAAQLTGRWGLPPLGAKLVPWG
jgi:hypothetical protein